MKTITVVFLLAQILDVVTTIIGVQMPGVLELHPAGFSGRALLAKLVAIVGVALILQLREWPKAAWIIPTVSAIPVFWNLLVILAEVTA